MTYHEYKEILEKEIYYAGKPKSFIQRLRIRYIQPNTNCMALARKMWYLFGAGKINRFRAKMIYLRILRKYGCCIYPSAKVDEGFCIAHPVGIVIGECTVGKNFVIYQNTTIGVKSKEDTYTKNFPKIGNNVRLCSNAIIIGGCKIVDNVTIGAGAVVCSDLMEQGTYVGVPAKKVNRE